MSVLKRYNGSDWEIIGMGISQDVSEISGVNKILTPANPSGLSGTVTLTAGDIYFDASQAYSNLTIGNRLQQTISTATPLIADYNTSYYDINNAITNNRIVYVVIGELRYYFMSKGTTSGMGWIKFVANTGSDINIITYNSDGSKVIDQRNSSSIFWATYGTTDSDTIIASYNAGQLCGVRYNNDVYLLSNIYEVSAGAFEVQFINLEQNSSSRISYKTLICQGNTWDILSNYIPFESALDNLKLDIYPIGSIYMSSNSTSPSELFGGDWERITGKFLLGATDASNGGAEPSSSPIQKSASVQAEGYGGEATHTLINNELPLITKTFSTRGIGSSGNDLINNVNGYTISSTTSSQRTVATETVSAYTKNISFTIGGGASHNNMPPFLAVYMWRRIA